MKKLVFCLLLVGALLGTNVLDKAPAYSYEEAPGPHNVPVFAYEQALKVSVG